MSKPKLKIDIKFAGIDWWSRPVFKHTEKEIYFGSTDILFPDKEKAPNSTPKEISDWFRKDDNIVYIDLFGSEFDCEPLGGMGKHVELTIID